MIRGMYAAATALDAATQNQDVVAQNLAHASTPGYRAKGAVFETFDRVLGRASGDIVGTHLAEGYTDFKPGGLQQTGHPFDLALGNDAFFVLGTPTGQVFSRNGTFRVTPDGQLLSHDGYAVQSRESGAIRLPPGAASVVVAANGTVTADGVNVGRIQIARFDNPNRLTPVGPTLFRGTDEAGQQPADNGILQGFRESSNVSAAQAMVEMISGTRYFEAAQRALRTIGESVQLNTRPT